MKPRISMTESKGRPCLVVRACVRITPYSLERLRDRAPVARLQYPFASRPDHVPRAAARP